MHHPLLRALPAAVLLLAAAAPAPAQTTQRVRIAAANLTSGNSQSWLDPGNRILQGLDPDIILMNEFTIGTSASQTTTDTNAWVSTVFGAGFSWFREPGNEQIPNGIVSRYPIVASGEFNDAEVSNRDFAWARIDLPGDKDLWAVSVHLLTTGSSVRNTEAQALVSALQGAGIPAGDYVVIGGDFNTGSRSESCVNTFRTHLGVAAAQEHTPVDQAGNSNTNAGRNSPFDWVLVNAALNARHTSTVIASNSFTHGLVFDSRVYSPLSAVSPVQSGDSGATNMQHMAVVKDFLIPVTASDFSLDTNSVDFGTVNATAGPFGNSSATILVTNPFSLNSVQFAGTGASEFSLTAPNLSGGAVAISTNTDLVFRWNPPSNDGAARSVTATFATGGTPSSFQIGLAGRTQTAGGGGTPLDVSGHVIEQSNSTVTITLPASTSIPANGFLVIGRNASKASFENAWGVTLGSNVVYINGTDVVAANGFPVINGDEVYAVRTGGGVPVDPASGTVPSPALASGASVFRTATDATAFTSRPLAQATPGTYEGTAAQTGKLVISEVSDASAFANEFIELYYDAPPAAQPVRDGWVAR